MDAKAQISLAVVPLVIMSIAFGTVLSLSNGNAPTVTDVLSSSMDNRSVVFLGVSPESNPILDEVNGMTTNISRSDDISTLSAIGNDSMVLIDGDWARKVDKGVLVSAVRTLIIAGVPVVIINGEPGIIKEAIGDDHQIGYMTSVSSNPLCSEGIHYDAARQCGASYAYSSIDGNLGLAGLSAYEWCAQFMER